MKNFSLFEDSNDMKQVPLASRMRPRTIDEIVGQEYIIGQDKLLYRSIKADRLESIILYGSPGTGYEKKIQNFLSFLKYANKKKLIELVQLIWRMR